MISNQILQNTIEGIKSISRVDLHVADTDGKIIASTSQLGDEFGHAILALLILRQTASQYRNTSSLRFMMKAS